MTQNGVECIAKNQVESWLKENDVRMYTYVSDVKVNFSDKDNYTEDGRVSDPDPRSNREATEAY